MAIQGSGAISRVYVKDRTADQVFSQPPVVEVGGVSPTPLNQATIVPVLFRNTVYTYSPKNVKSLYSAFGSGNKNKFSADIELERTKLYYNYFYHRLYVLWNQRIQVHRV